MIDLKRTRIYRYAEWVDEQLDDAMDGPMLIGVFKLFLFGVIPLGILLLVTLAAGIFVISLLWRFIPWLFDLVWI